MPNQIIHPAKKQNPVATMITHGRRSLGEDWRKIAIYPDPDTGTYIIDNEPTEAPADNKPIIVPGLGNISIEMADFMLEWQREKAKERAKKPRQSMEDYSRELNAAWLDYMEQKLQWFKGQTTVGPAGLMQREKP